MMLDISMTILHLLFLFRNISDRLINGPIRPKEQQNVVDIEPELQLFVTIHLCF